MASEYAKIEQQFIDSLLPNTGNDLNKWLKIIKTENLDKRNEIQMWLKSQYDFSHSDAGMLASIYMNNGKPVYADEDELLTNQFKGKENMKSLYEYLIGAVKTTFPECTIVPKKTYISITEGREFAAINVKKDELRIGFDLGDMPYTDELQKSKLTGPMPRISHMVVMQETHHIDDSFKEYLSASHKRTNKK